MGILYGGGELTTWQALAQAFTKVSGLSFRVRYDYLDMNAVMKVLKDLSLPVSGQIFDTQCSVDVRVRLTLVEAFRERMGQIGSCQLEEL